MLEGDDHFHNYWLLSCYENVFFHQYILNPKVEFVDEKHKAKGSVCGNRKGCTPGAQFLCYHFAFVFSAEGQLIGRCK